MTRSIARWPAPAVLLLAALGVACSSPRGTDAPDASSSTAEGASASLGFVERVRAELAVHGYQPVVQSGASLALSGDAFVASFAKAPSATVRLPLRATAPFVLSKNDMRLHVTLLGAHEAKGTIDGDAVVYAGALPNAALFHVPTTEGTEEYVRFDAKPELSQLRYRLAFENVAGLRLVDGDVMELLDRTGNPVLRTTAPYVVDANGTMRRGALALEDCQHDASAAAPWGRPVVAPPAKGCTLRASWSDEGLAYPLLVDPPWTATGGLATKRTQHGATRISGSAAAACASGCVLATGGVSGTGASAVVVSAAELYNVATGTWASAGSSIARRWHAQADVGGGKALVAGGATDTTASPVATTTAQLYSPSTGWSATAALPAARYAAAILPTTSGTFLTGGYASGGAVPQNTVYIYNGSSWSTGTPMTNARARHQISAFVTGSATACDAFVVAGGIGVGGSSIATVEFYGLGAGGTCAGTGWANVGSMSSPRVDFASAFWGGKVFLFGGSNSLLASEPAEIIDVVKFGSGTVSVGPWMNGSTTMKLATRRTGLAAAIAVSGAKSRIVVMGGASSGGLPGAATGQTDLVDSTAIAVTTGSPMLSGRRNHVAVNIGSTKVLAVGGMGCNSGCYPASEEIWDFAANGSSCVVGDECVNGQCVDGVCCDSACTGQCQACNEAGSVGTCKTVAGAPRGTRAACPSPSTGTCGYQCNGTNATACVAAGSTTTCTAPTCTSGVATPASKCDGAGNCVAQMTLSCGTFACNPAGTACLAPPCTDNADCASGYKCDSASKNCVPTGGVGSPCTITTDCSGGLSCVDSVCCTAPSCSGGQKCNIPGSAGSCKAPYGSACTAATASTCPTGNCVDGVCCDTPCSGQCEQCNLSGFAGSCKPVPAGGKPAGARTACAGTGACQASCDGSSRVTCGPAPGPTVVCAAAACATGTSTPTRYCNGLGTCTPASSSSCGAYKCDPSACKTSCSTVADCVAGYFCNASGQCVTTGASGTTCSTDSECTTGHCVDGVCCKTASCTVAGQKCDATTDGTCALPIAATCTSGTQCGSGFCADGVCCNAACNGQCEACDVGGVVGTCSPVAGNPHPGRTACIGTGACQAKCDGSDRTKCGAAPGTSTICAGESCAGTAYTGPSFCDGIGGCSTPPVASCSAYKCDATKCKTSCITSADCSTGYGCKSGLCVTTGALGTVCTDPTQCTSGKCVAGSGGKTVCCTVDSCPGGSVCADDTAGDRAGTCVKPRGTACASKDECASGFCVDGVCCDGACAGQCESCSVPGAEGTCSGVSGPPATGKAPCFDGGGDVCKAQACDGSKDRTKCTAFKNGVETECAMGSCTDRTETAPSRCDGSGECKAGSMKACGGGYKCGATTCNTTCSGPTDCAVGFSCLAGKCEAVTAKCQDGVSVPVDGSATRPCTPYRCDDATGGCVTSCTGSTDCIDGAVCNNGHCETPPAADTESSGGCALDDRGASRGAAGFVLAALAMGLFARRRRT